MTQHDLSAEVGVALCNACSLARKQGNLNVSDLVQEALETAGDEIGALPYLAQCPSGGNGQDCPLIKPKPL